MKLKSRRLVVPILAVGLVAVAAGCGGGGKKNTSSTQTTMTHTTSTTTTTSGNSNSGSATKFASAKNCQDLAGIAAKAAAAITATSGNPATTLNTEANVLQGLANAAPSAIHADFETIAAAFSSFLHALAKAGYKPGATITSPPSASQIAALGKAAQVFNNAKVAKAEQHLNSWVKQNCKGVKVGG
jgi:hypothetical protein